MKKFDGKTWKQLEELAFQNASSKIQEMSFLEQLQATAGAWVVVTTCRAMRDLLGRMGKSNGTNFVYAMLEFQGYLGLVSKRDRKRLPKDEPYVKMQSLLRYFEYTAVILELKTLDYSLEPEEVVTEELGLELLEAVGVALEQFGFPTKPLHASEFCERFIPSAKKVILLDDVLANLSSFNSEKDELAALEKEYERIQVEGISTRNWTDYQRLQTLRRKHK